jgi:hypothetical protein
MTIDLALFNHLKNKSVISSALHPTIRQKLSEAAILISSLNKGQIWAGKVAPVGTKGPYQTIFYIASSPEMRRINVPVLTYQIDCFGLNYDVVIQMHEATIDSLNDFAGHLGGTDGPEINAITFDSDGFDYENDTHFYHLWAQFKIIQRS